MKVVTVVGARPQFIKAAPVQRAFAAQPSIEHLLVHTGQHFDAAMSDVFFEQLGLAPPDHHLGVNSGAHGDMTGRMMSALEPVLQSIGPDWVLVYGDTNSTLAAALVASKIDVRLAHVEAGLRSFNRAMPEEINRVVTDHVSNLCFAPTDAALANLDREGISGHQVVRTGDVMLDAVRLFEGAAPVLEEVVPGLARPFALATIHRAENTDDPSRLAGIIDALEEVARAHAVVLPLHPRTRAAAEAIGRSFEAVQVIPPVGYLEMLRLEHDADVVVTDSGGVQKEAFFQGTPCVTIRTETEWVELVELGWNRLCDPTEPAAIVGAVRAALADGPGIDAEPYGDGRSAARIVAALVGA